MQALQDSNSFRKKSTTTDLASSEVAVEVADTATTPTETEASVSDAAPAPVLDPAPVAEIESSPIVSPAKQKPYEWILSPTIDLMFACGGVLWLLYGAFLLGAKPVLEAGIAAACMWWICKFGLIFFSYGHQPATLWRVYGSPKTRKTLGPIVAVWGVVAIAALTCSMFIQGFVGVFTKLIIFWQIQHVLAQSYGIALIYCYKRGYYMNDFEKRSFLWMINASIVYFLLRACTFESCGKKNMYGLEIPFWGPLPIWIYSVSLACLVVITSVFAYNVIAKYRRDKQLFPWPGLLGVGTGLLTYHLDFAFFGAAFSLFTIAYYHGCQYLVVTTAFYLKERGLPEGLPMAKIGSLLTKPSTLRYFFCLSVGGVILSDLLPRGLSTFGLSAAAAYMAVFATANFHHYFADGLIWKLRDPEVRKLLVA